MRFSVNNIKFEVPDTWKDDSVYVFTHQVLNSHISLIVTRENVPQGETAAAYGEKQITSLSKNLASFQLVGKGSAPGVTNVYDIGYVWTDPVQGIIRQQQRYVISGGQALTFTMTTKKESYPSLQKTISEILNKISGG